MMAHDTRDIAMHPFERIVVLRVVAEIGGAPFYNQGTFDTTNR